MSIAIERLKRAIADLPKGGMQTGDYKVNLKLADAQRAIAELEGLKAERDALAAKVEKLIAEFKDAIETLQTIAGCTWDSGAEEIADVALDEAKRWVSRYDDSVLKNAPAQHLAEIRTSAGLDGFIAGAEYAYTSRELAYFPDSLRLVADGYAAKLSNGEQK